MPSPDPGQLANHSFPRSFHLLCKAHVPVAPYIRVSTDEQVETGYSLRGQKRALLDHASREGWHVVEVVEDDGYSGGDPWRPGLRRILELAESGEIDAVAAYKRDRLFRSRYYRLDFERKLAGFGVTMLSLNDTGHKIGDGVLDDFAEWEREEIAKRLHGGIRNMTTEGRIKAGPKPPYGYRLDPEQQMLYVFEPEMEVVRTVFEMAATGASRKAIRRRLDEDDISSPGKSANGWNLTTISNILKNDLYKPHAFEEVRAVVSPEIANNLDTDALYGLWSWNRRKTTKRKEWSDERREYVERYSSEVRPPDQMLYVPVPDAGVPLEVVEAARENMTCKRPWATSSAVGGWVWELRGMARCASCGSVLSTHTSGKHHYYACRRRYNNSRRDCDNHRYFRADELERHVLEAMRMFLDKREYFLEKFDAYAEEERARLRRTVTGLNVQSCYEELDRVEKKRSGYLDLAAEGIIDRDELRARLSRLDDERQRLQEGLEAAANYERDVASLEEHLIETRKAIENASKEWLNSRATGNDRHDMYRRLRMVAKVGKDGETVISGVFGTRKIRRMTNTHWRP